MEITFQKILRTRDGKTFEVTLGAAAKIESFFVFSLHKAGSTLLYNMLEQVCRLLQIPQFEPELEEYQQGVQLGSLDETVLELFYPQGYCYSGFRIFPEYLAGFDLTGFKKILLIRDPRDILVSHYFSQKYSHNIPTGELGARLQARRNMLQNQVIDDYVMENASQLKQNFEIYHQHVFDDRMRLFRYEDVVLKKGDWLREMLDYLELSLPQTELERIVKTVDHQPKVENPLNHIRKVTPGDYREKLHPFTIEYLNEVFSEILQRYQYEIPPDADSKVFRRKCG